MRVSFDLDDTLILQSGENESDSSLPPLRRSYIEERLRAGTRDLMLALVSRGCEIWIYTNSWRGKTELSAWFVECGLPVAGIVNQQIHDMKREELAFLPHRPRKFPPWFGIDVHIDDSAELEEDAAAHGFKVVRIAPDDPDWAATILAALDKIGASLEKQLAPDPC